VEGERMARGDGSMQKVEGAAAWEGAKGGEEGRKREEEGRKVADSGLKRVLNASDQHQRKPSQARAESQAMATARLLRE